MRERENDLLFDHSILFLESLLIKSIANKSAAIELSNYLSNRIFIKLGRLLAWMIQVGSSAQI